jgi:hypothetical protein
MIPKPLIRVGRQADPETVPAFAGPAWQFFISVNTKSAIRDHFGDGSVWGVEINYLQENARPAPPARCRCCPSGRRSHFCHERRSAHDREFSSSCLNITASIRRSPPFACASIRDGRSA